MTTASAVVIDASALLATLHDEPGGAYVASVLRTAAISAVNWSEVVQKSIARDADVAAMREMIELLGVTVAPFTAADAELTAALWSETRSAGLSLGDRACLALAIREHATAVTADRAWGSLSLDVQIQLIR